MTSEGRVDWGSLIFRPFKSMHEDKSRRPRSVLVSLGALAFLAFLALGLSQIHSGDDFLGTISIVVGLVAMLCIWYYASWSIRRTTGIYRGWYLDARSFLIGMGILIVGLVVTLDPGHVVSDATYPYHRLIWGLGFAVALFGFVYCIFSLRE